MTPYYYETRKPLEEDPVEPKPNLRVPLYGCLSLILLSLVYGWTTPGWFLARACLIVGAYFPVIRLLSRSSSSRGRADDSLG